MKKIRQISKFRVQINLHPLRPEPERNDKRPTELVTCEAISLEFRSGKQSNSMLGNNSHKRLQ